MKIWPWSKIQMYRENAYEWQDKYFAARAEVEAAAKERESLREKLGQQISGLLAERDAFAKRVEELEEKLKAGLKVYPDENPSPVNQSDDKSFE